MSKIGQNLNKMYTSIKARIPFAPKVGIVLGSGLGGILDKLDIKGVIPYKDIEGFPQSTAPDHKGQFLFAYINDVPVVIMPRTGEITLLQTDGNLTDEEFEEAINLAIEGCMEVSKVQKEALKNHYVKNLEG